MARYKLHTASTKICRGCGIEKDVSTGFGKYKRGITKVVVQSYCRECRNGNIFRHNPADRIYTSAVAEFGRRDFLDAPIIIAEKQFEPSTEPGSVNYVVQSPLEANGREVLKRLYAEHYPGDKCTSRSRNFMLNKLRRKIQ